MRKVLGLMRLRGIAPSDGWTATPWEGVGVGEVEGKGEVGFVGTLKLPPPPSTPPPLLDSFTSDVAGMGRWFTRELGWRGTAGEVATPLLLCTCDCGVSCDSRPSVGRGCTPIGGLS